MRPAENIEKLIKNINIDTNAGTDKAVLGDVIDAFEKSKMTNSAITQPNIRRTIMKSPITKLTATAVIIIACLTGLFLWKNTGSGIALADVLIRIEQVTAYMYQMRSTLTRQQTSIESMITVLISEEHGLKMVINTVDPKSGEIEPARETYLSHRPNSITFVSHEQKAYFKLKYEDDRPRFYREECNDPRTIIKQFLSCNHTSLGQSIINGITVEGFQTTDLSYKGGFFGQAEFEGGDPANVDVKIWVDVNTFLPVRSEEDIVTKDGRHIHEVSYDFRWNVVVNADDFRPVVPDDYSTDEMVLPEYNEEAAIKGLRLFASLAGTYPVNLNKKTLDRKAPRILHLPAADSDSWKALPEDERSKKMSELASIAVVGFFYRTLVDENKDPAYYGETVRPDDTNKVLLRWKLDDGQYRVIYGDLSIKNVTPEELAELEKP